MVSPRLARAGPVEALEGMARQRGPFMSGGIACGVLLLGPETEYSARLHQAGELYLPRSAHAGWRSAKSLAAAHSGRTKLPCHVDHHAVRTVREPALAAYVWRAGGLVAKSRIDEFLSSPIQEKGRR